VNIKHPSIKVVHKQQVSNQPILWLKIRLIILSKVYKMKNQTIFPVSVNQVAAL